ncbi:hypothetical protein FRB99_001801 [Tulasnella sp. 403]|nr:hypothetical protein FRB99_001801 [Tulasnella sp. 403]
MTETVTLENLTTTTAISLSPSPSTSKNPLGVPTAVSSPHSDEEQPSVALFRTDPFQFKSAIKTDAELAELRNRKKSGKRVEKYYKDQNELIGNLLKPLEEHTSDAKEAEDAAKLPVRIAVLASLLANAALCILQIYATVTSGSLAILAAGIDSVFDIGANVILGWFHRKAKRLDHNKWPVGGSRLETIGNITYGSLMASVNLVVVVECVRDMVSNQELKEFHLIPLLSVAVALGTAIPITVCSELIAPMPTGVKLALFIYCFALRGVSSQVRMLWEDHRNDLFVNSFAILMSAGGSKLRWWLDPLGGLLIALAIIGSWLFTVYREFEFLAGKSAPHEFLQLVIYKVATFSDQIAQVDTVRAYHSGPNYFVEVDIVMDGNTPLWQAHDLSQQMQDKLETLPGVERAFVHVDHETTHRPSMMSQLAPPGSGEEEKRPSTKREPMSMDRKNKKAAQQALQAQQQVQAQQSSGSQSQAPQDATNSASSSSGANRDRRDRGRQKRDKERGEPPANGRHDPRPSVDKTLSSTHSAGRDKERDRDKDRERNRSGKPQERHDHSGSGVGSDDHSSVVSSSVSTLRPPIRIGKGPMISASVTAPPVLRDTSATSSSSFQAAQPNDLDVDRGWATTSLEQLQAHSRQSTMTPATAAAVESLAASSDYSKTPSASVADLPAPSNASAAGSSVTRKEVENLTSSPTRTSAVRPTLPTASSRNASNLHRTRLSGEEVVTIGTASASVDLVGSPPLRSTEREAHRDFGPIGSPRSGNAFPSASSPGRGALSSLLAGLSIAHGVNTTNFQPLQPRPEMRDTQHGEDGPSSVSSQSNLHASMNPNVLGTSPFSVPGSRSLFLNYPAAGESSSANSQSNLPAFLGGMKGGNPASFAGSRPIGWSINGGARRPSLPGHNQRPSIGAASVLSGGLDESALEEENDMGDTLEAEEFLPSSLNNLLTKEERARKFSRSGGKPTKESLIGRHPKENTIDVGDDDPDDDAWNDTIRARPATDKSLGATSTFSRSVPATGLLGNMRALWEKDNASGMLQNDLQVSNEPSFVGMSRAVSNNTSQPHDVFNSLSGSYGPSPSMLSTSVMSNASNAFLRSSRAGGPPGGYGGESSNGLMNGITVPQIGGVGMSYNPQGNFLHRQQQSLSQAGHSSQAQHHHHTSLSGISTIMQPSRSQAQALPPPQAGNQYSMYSGPSDLGVDSKQNAAYGLHQPQRGAGPVNQGARNDPIHPQGHDPLRHEPGQSLPRGLGAGLSRIHFVPAVSLTSTTGSPTPGSAFGSGLGSSGMGGVASPPSGYGNLPKSPNQYPAQAVGANYGIGIGPNADILTRNRSTTPTKGYGSGLTARLAAASASGTATNSPNTSANTIDLGVAGDGSQPMLNIHSVRNANSPWGRNGTPRSVSSQSAQSGVAVDDVEVDEGTLFSMD